MRKEFLLIYKGKQELDYSPEKLQQRLDEYNIWASNLGNRHVAQNRLQRSGAHLKGKSTYVTDGPFLEAKEIIAGYTIITADSLQAAIDDANNCPLLQYFEIYVRELI